MLAETIQYAQKCPDIRDDGALSFNLPSVSVIIPVKNDATRLAVCLSSLNKQNYPNECIEIVVVDNDSTDRSVDIARQYGAKVWSLPGKNVGALRNYGVGVATGRILAFVDSDHEVPSNWVGTGVGALTRDPGTSIVGSHYLAPPDGTCVQRTWARHRLRRRAVHTTSWLGAGNMFLRRSDFVALGGFREDLVAAEDVDLCLRASSQRGKVVCDPAIENVHHGEPRTLVQFFRKEYWRGSSGIRAFIAQGFPLRELPTLLYPAWHLVALGAAVTAVALLPWHASVMWIALAMACLVCPAVLLATLTSLRWKSARPFAPLVVLYLAYGLARAAALFKS